MTTLALPLPAVSGRRAFGAALLAATMVPFFLPWVSGTALTLEKVIAFVAAIHVPMTLYLLFDPEIRAMLGRRPVALIGAPVAFLAASCVVFVWLPGPPVVYYMTFVLVWQFWHFGKQNVGVYSFTRLTQKAGRMAATERRLIVSGSFLGALAAYLMSAEILRQYAPDDFPVLLFWPVPALQVAGEVASAVLLLASLVYVVRNRDRLTWSSAAILLVGANFFLPYYVTAVSLPNLIGTTTLAHGVQYMVFLLFHATSYRAGWAKAGMVAAFGGAVWFTGNLTSWTTGNIGMGIAIGILLSHFWLDSFFWRMKNPESAKWMAARFAFVFGK